MAFKTVDTNAFHSVEIGGEKVGIKCLTNGQLEKLSAVFDQADKTVDSLLAVIAPYVQIEGVKAEDTALHLTLISDSAIQAQIITAVFTQNKVSKAEEKNSASLSDGLANSNPARESNTTTTVEMADSASALLSEMQSLESSAKLN